MHLSNKLFESLINCEGITWHISQPHLLLRGHFSFFFQRFNISSLEIGLFFFSIEKLAVSGPKSVTLITGVYPCVPADTIIRLKVNSLNLPCASVKEGSHNITSFSEKEEKTQYMKHIYTSFAFPCCLSCWLFLSRLAV